MDNDDNDFFILVLGVLAAIILVISWWYSTGGFATPATTAVAETEHSADEADDDNESHDDDAEAEPEQEPEPEQEETFEVEEEPVEEEAEEPAAAPPVAAAASLLDVMVADSDLSVITNLIRDEGLDGVLAATDGDPLTVFAPSNDAVSEAAGSDTTVALLESNRQDVLTYHVVPGEYSVEDLVELARGSRSAQLATLQGEPLSLSLDGDSLIINGNTVISGDPQFADTGVVHTLDNVLVPPVAALNSIVSSEPILFASGSADIQAESFATLDRFIEVLSNNDVAVSIEGHTDSSGDPILNQNLSQSRARSVLNYLVANGIEESRLSATGFGPDRPVADNETEEGRALNRRIEFQLQS